MQSLEYRRHKLMWDGLLVGLEEAYIIGLARITLPLAKNGKGSQRYPNQVALETWLPNFKIKNKEHEKYLTDWRHKAFAHIDTKMIGRVDRRIMTSLVGEAMDALEIISKVYKPEYDYRADFKELGKQAEDDFLRLLETIKKSR